VINTFGSVSPSKTSFGTPDNLWGRLCAYQLHLANTIQTGQSNYGGLRITGGQKTSLTCISNFQSSTNPEQYEPTEATLYLWLDPDKHICLSPSIHINNRDKKAYLGHDSNGYQWDAVYAQKIAATYLNNLTIPSNKEGTIATTSDCWKSVSINVTITQDSAKQDNAHSTAPYYLDLSGSISTAITTPMFYIITLTSSLGEGAGS
jgi:hypothetical protein